MAVIVGYLNVRNLSSNWHQGRVLNDIRSQNLDVIVTTETWLKRSRDLIPLLDGSEKFLSLSANTWERGVGPFEKKQGFKEKVNPPRR